MSESVESVKVSVCKNMFMYIVSITVARWHSGAVVSVIASQQGHSGFKPALCVQVSSGHSGFLPQAKDIHIRSIGYSKLPTGVNVSVFVFLY